MVDAKLGPDVLGRLSRAIEFWVQNGYQFVELPWVAPAHCTDATKPAFVTAADLATPYGNLVASGEQSFLMLCERNLLPAGDRFVGWTPCFRQEPVFDATHHLYFMKAEVFVKAPSLERARAQMPAIVSGARYWMQEELQRSGCRQQLSLEQLAPDQTDIMLGDVELGSYGIREFAGQVYLYGTACAEPRFTHALARHT